MSKLPAELQLPDEPILESPSKESEKNLNGAGKKGKSDLFTNELMPEVRPGAVQGDSESNSLIAPQKKKAEVGSDEIIEKPVAEPDAFNKESRKSILDLPAKEEESDLDSTIPEPSSKKLAPKLEESIPNQNPNVDP